MFSYQYAFVGDTSRYGFKNVKTLRNAQIFAGRENKKHLTILKMLEKNCPVHLGYIVQRAI